ncbi:hypothetical protein [Halorientalis pallida]|uniref:DUF4352 domain-containing protein n=1 Tax=Halorientalis pallida TaxID=2479928 RepID=A0A498KT80_9EURY|nr:hypothetical protein [Halorientalis pallida]RXK46399.1 hypothetical protein EAF64_19085 [Halorientalis pallida]
MRQSRRGVLRTGALALAAGLAGCGARDDGTTGAATTDGTATGDAAGCPATPMPEGCVVESSAGDADPIPTTADGTADAETTLSVRWNARTQPSMSPDDSEFLSYSPARGMVYVVFRLELTPAVDRPVDVGPYGVFGLRAQLCDATWYLEPPLRSLDAGFEVSVDLSPGETRAGVLGFEVPAELDAATLVRYADADEQPDSAFEATCDRDLDVGIGL